MRKLSSQEIVRSISMFFLNSDIDEKYTKKLKDTTEELSERMKHINTRNGLEQFIRNNSDAFELLLMLLGISLEYFKRVISLFRLQLGLSFKTEWSDSATRTYALSNPVFMNKLLDLFILADESDELSQYIPKFKLSSFKITPAIMERLKSPDFLKFLCAKDVETSFNNDMAFSKKKLLEDVLTQICLEKGFTLKKQQNVDPNGNNTRSIPVNYTVSKPGKSLPSFYINYSFYLTTSKGQTTIKNTVKDIRDFIIRQNPEAIQLFIVDGAGWIGRQSDLYDICDYSNFILTLKHLEQIKNIII
jgi:hypothetical protein